MDESWTPPAIAGRPAIPLHTSNIYKYYVAYQLAYAEREWRKAR